MEYLGKTVRLHPSFIANQSAQDGDAPFKVGIVVEQVNLSGSRALLIVDDPLFGTWKAVDTNILEVTEIDTTAH